MKPGINTEVALTYLFSKKKQTVVASLGVTFGIGMYIFMNSLIQGTNEYFEQVTLSTVPHIRLFNESKISGPEMLDQYSIDSSLNIISNPQAINSENRIANPYALVQFLRQQREVVAVSPQVLASVVCANGNVQKSGNISGVDIMEMDKMFDISGTLVAGKVEDLSNNPDGIIIGQGMAKLLNLKKNDVMNVSASNGSIKRLRVVAVFKTTIKNIDDTKCYVNTSVAQQLLRKDRGFITDIYVNIANHNESASVGKLYERQSGLHAETWQAANEQSIAARMIRDVIANAVVITILVVAGFGIYNILNMMVYEKIKEIAILKATGFMGKHVISIFITQALLIGILGGLLGMLFGFSVSKAVSLIYIGKGNLESLPMSFYAKHYLQGFTFGLVTAFFAGYVPAVKAADVDPVKIIRG